ncbi:hypothetical protein [Shewanella vesiculosa]
MHVLEKCVEPDCDPEELLPWKVNLG